MHISYIIFDSSSLFQRLALNTRESSYERGLAYIKKLRSSAIIVSSSLVLLADVYTLARYVFHNAGSNTGFQKQ